MAGYSWGPAPHWGSPHLARKARAAQSSSKLEHWETASLEGRDARSPRSTTVSPGRKPPAVLSLPQENSLGPAQNMCKVSGKRPRSGLRLGFPGTAAARLNTAHNCKLHCCNERGQD